MRCGGRPVMSSPSNTTRPPVGRSTPVRQLKNVDLPAPLGPISPRIAPLATESDTLLSAASPPKRTVSALVSRIVDEELSADTRGVTERSAPGFPGRPERREGWGALSRPPMSPGSREFARRRDDRPFLRDRFQQLVLVVLDLEDELPQERLVVFLPDRLVALREVVAFLDLH